MLYLVELPLSLKKVDMYIYFTLQYINLDSTYTYKYTGRAHGHNTYVLAATPSTRLIVPPFLFDSHVNKIGLRVHLLQSPCWWPLGHRSSTHRGTDWTSFTNRRKCFCTCCSQEVFCDAAPPPRETRGSLRTSWLVLWSTATHL